MERGKQWAIGMAVGASAGTWINGVLQGLFDHSFGDLSRPLCVGQWQR